jgi:ABC-type lipoprotein export system ATPase subunit
VQLDRRLDFVPRDLSDGEKQRVSIARAMANRPRLILADEPTGNLDSNSGHVVVEMLTELARQQGSGVVIVIHDSRIWMWPSCEEVTTSLPKSRTYPRPDRHPLDERPWP